ncbi:hypothetical protein GUJ93_ZPchr0008g12641 [Zizania palustris]|uniref:Uncharacterized protein n=1 Tax=Zizania palustris TaxID=103762 RepID=A0A8J5V4U0_ZIZPA|nr:hypothetical protein GUJ93_ZPchr0008g12641 [Zizania palustris]
MPLGIEQKKMLKSSAPNWRSALLIMEAQLDNTTAMEDRSVSLSKLVLAERYEAMARAVKAEAKAVDLKKKIKVAEEVMT